MNLDLIKARCEVRQASERVTTPCWLWQGATNKGGYGVIAVARKTKTLHREVYMAAHGVVDSRQDIHHICRVRNCANHEHLEKKTRLEHAAEHPERFESRASQTHCKRGHEFTPENTRIYVRGRYSMRQCRKCFVLFNRNYRAKKRAE